ncbi:MAG: SagB/ThcOx family dehydrogenase, partial [Ignavibacteriaceae bacterium]|nr:SagB/ThcOx family dehydrogenase [Ignavibacteriaceae bacterium]
ITTNFFCQDKKGMQNSESDIIQLPAPNYKSNTSIEEALQKRRSVRDYSNKPLSLSEVSQILWAAQGITDETDGLRTAPSAGALYPLEVYLVAANVEELIAGIYKYDPQDHTIKKIAEGDKRAEISNAALRQNAIEEASALVIITAVYERTSVKYGKRSERYVNMEVGHVGQNIFLQAVSLGLSTVMIGAFGDEALKQVMNLPANEFPLAIYPLGKI